MIAVLEFEYIFESRVNRKVIKSVTDNRSVNRPKHGYPACKLITSMEPAHILGLSMGKNNLRTLIIFSWDLDTLDFSLTFFLKE